MHRPRLGVNIDHIATIRQARKTYEPDPVWGAALAVLGGADVITVHLREDRRHIQERDVRCLKETAQVPINLEMALDEQITEFALEIMPYQCTLVPERREEVTTEGGLDIIQNLAKVRLCVQKLQAAGMIVSLFIAPDLDQIQASHDIGVSCVELHTGRYADAVGWQKDQEFRRLLEAGRLVRELNLHLHMGHGLNYQNTSKLAEIPEIAELNIGHSIISRSVFTGIEQAVREMKELILNSFVHKL